MGTFPRVTHPSATDPRRGPFDLHVLGLPPAFALSQDQTLKLKSSISTKSQNVLDRVLTIARRFHPACELSKRKDQSMSLSSCTSCSPQGHRRLRFSLSVSTCQRAKDNNATPPAQSRSKAAIVHNHSPSQTLIQEPNPTADEPDISSPKPRVNTSLKQSSEPMTPSSEDETLK